MINIIPVNMVMKSASERANMSTRTSSDMRSLMGSRKAALSVVGAVWMKKRVQGESLESKQTMGYSADIKSAS